MINSAPLYRYKCTDGALQALHFSATCNKDEIKAGRIIGTFERMIMLFFINIGQYSSIGLVLTAKSIARYDKISKSQSFAEYYLLGTLLSTISVLIISLI